jgi:predicted AAA+ superfamily ATPase
MSGRWLNYSKLSSDAEIPKETIRRYVSILEDTLLAHRLAAYRPSPGSSRRVSSRDRILLFDVGVCNALLGRHRFPPSLDQRGPLFEQWFILQVLAIKSAFRKPWRLTSYRTEAGAEVDLVIETDDRILGIEIKAGRSVQRSAGRGLRSLSEVIPRSSHYSKWIVFTGERAQKLDNGTFVLPYSQALKDLLDF